MKSFRDKYPELFTEEFLAAYAEEMRKLMIEIDPDHDAFVQGFIRENLPESKETTPLKSAAEYRAEIEDLERDLAYSRDIIQSLERSVARLENHILELEEYSAGIEAECIDLRAARGGRDE